MPEIKEPESLSNVNDIKVTPEIEEFVSKLDSTIESGKSDRSEWEQRVDNYTRKRYGIRPKKTFPWVGSANFVLPQIDSDINRIKPSYINLRYGVSPVVTFEPFGSEDIIPARKREILYDWRMRTQVKFFKEYALGIDYLLHCGFVVFKTGWKFETNIYSVPLNLSDLPKEILDALYMPEVDDNTLFYIFAEEIKPDMTFQENVDEINRVVLEFREGKTEFEFKFIEKSENRAEAIALNPREDVFFPIDTVDIQKARYVAHRFTVSKNSVRLSMKQGKYRKFDEYEIDSWRSAPRYQSISSSTKAVRDGVNLGSYDDEDIVLIEASTWYDVNDDGIDERVIITYPENNPSVILRFIENPYDHGQFPFTVVRREFNDAPIISSRGIPALDDDFQTGISTLFNQDIDAGTISTTPTIVARRNSVKNLRNLRYVPGQVIETENGSADYTVTQNPNLGQTARFNNMQYLKAWANDRIGNVTAAISQSNNAPGNGQQGQKTAREVASIEAGSSQLQSMDLLVFQQQIVDLDFQIDSLYYQFGDESEEIAITGQPPIKISRQEVRGKFNIIPNGRLDNSNPVLRSQRSLAMLQMFINDPYIRQEALRKYYLDDIDIRVSQQLLKTPEELQRDAMSGIQAENDKLKTTILMQKAKNDLDVMKEAQLTPITGRKYASD